MTSINLMKGDCLERMKEIPDKSVDMVLTDPPYGTTACKWDSVIPFDKMWAELKRIIKNERSAIVLFGSEPFSSALRMSNIKEFRYDWIWQKARAGNFSVAKFQPMKDHEMIHCFGIKSPNYLPIKEPRKGAGLKRIRGNYSKGKASETSGFKESIVTTQGQELRLPSSIQFFNNIEKGKRLHPTQKPIALMEYLLKTYTIEGETVLDFTMGSGSTGVACKNLNRNFIGIERDEKYFEIAKNRIEDA